MKKSILSLAFILTLSGIALQFVAAPGLFIFESGKISFFSETPVENIAAETNNYAAALQPAAKKFAFSVLITGFQFEKSLMQEHFNENYMESDKFPKATFTGVIVEDLAIEEEGTYSLTAKGKLNIHGVEQERTIPVKLINKDGKYTFNSAFQVKLVDHNIEVPSIVVTNIAEVIDVKIEGVLKAK